MGSVCHNLHRFHSGNVCSYHVSEGIISTACLRTMQDERNKNIQYYSLTRLTSYLLNICCYTHSSGRRHCTVKHILFLENHLFYLKMINVFLISLFCIYLLSRVKGSCLKGQRLPTFIVALLLISTCPILETRYS